MQFTRYFYVLNVVVNALAIHLENNRSGKMNLFCKNQVIYLRRGLFRNCERLTNDKTKLN